MAKQVPTLKDLAKESGLSVSTVSRALHDHPAISEATIQRVKALAAQRGYVANGVARGLKSQNSRTIGVLVPEIRHDFFSSAIEGIEEIAFSKGYMVHIAKSGEEYQREVMNTLSFSSNRVAGVIASVSQNTSNGDHFRQLLERSIPVVLFDRVLEDLPVTKIVIDDYAAAYRAVSHLIEMGYQRIAHLAGPNELNISEERERGYRKALIDHGFSIDESLIRRCKLTEKSGAEGMKELLGLPAPPDAVFAVNDPVAVAAHQLIKAAGLNMPEDFGLVGFSNNPITALMDPPLTTTDQRGYELGKKAANTLLAQIQQGMDSISSKTHIVESAFIIRSSTARRSKER
jgi:DNA-binding LacI/PurR family transcriptional regulator